MMVMDYARRGVPWVELTAEHRAVPATLDLGLRERASVVAALVAAGAVVARRPGLVAGDVVATVALDADLHSVIARRLGARASVRPCPCTSSTSSSP